MGSGKTNAPQMAPSTGSRTGLWSHVKALMVNRNHEHRNRNSAPLRKRPVAHWPRPGTTTESIMGIHLGMAPLLAALMAVDNARAYVGSGLTLAGLEGRS